VEPAADANRVPSPFAAGEVTAGAHCANRLSGNCLLGCIVFGRRAREGRVRLRASVDAMGFIALAPPPDSG
jgi:succinate dehydrogenase/fumarate reductase flavoprotein subunit